MRTGANAGQDRRNGPAVVGSHMALMLIAHPCGSGRSPISGFVCALKLRETIASGGPEGDLGDFSFAEVGISLSLSILFITRYADSAKSGASSCGFRRRVVEGDSPNISR